MEGTNFETHEKYIGKENTEVNAKESALVDTGLPKIEMDSPTSSTSTSMLLTMLYTTKKNIIAIKKASGIIPNLALVAEAKKVINDMIALTFLSFLSKASYKRSSMYWRNGIIVK